MRVYILKSGKTGRYYCGHTEDLEERIIRHNSGQSSSTKHGIPWDLLWSVEMSSRSQAMKLENKIKSRGIARFLDDDNA